MNRCSKSQWMSSSSPFAWDICARQSGSGRGDVEVECRVVGLVVVFPSFSAPGFRALRVEVQRLIGCQFRCIRQTYRGAPGACPLLHLRWRSPHFHFTTSYVGRAQATD